MIIEIESMHPSDFKIMMERLGRLTASGDIIENTYNKGVLSVSHLSNYFCVTYQPSEDRSLFVKLCRKEDRRYFCYQIAKRIGPGVDGKDDTHDSIFCYKEIYDILHYRSIPYNKEDLEYEIQSWIEDYL